MRWDMLFSDLEAFAEATERAAFEVDVADRARSERAGLKLADRLRAHLASRLVFRLIDRSRVTGRLTDVGADWVLLEEGGSIVLPLAAVTGIEGLTRAASGEQSALARKVRLPVVLRRLARDRATVRVGTVDGGVVTGTIDRVGADHLDLALHAQDEMRRVGTVRSVLVLPLAGVLQIRSMV